MEISRKGYEPQIITEVYNRGDTAYLALDDVLPALNLSGYWHSTKHLYFINLPYGKASLYPGGAYMKYAYQYIALSEPALFIDGKLRVSEGFILQQLAQQLATPIYYRNLTDTWPENPPVHAVDSSEDQFFSFLLNSNADATQTSMRAIVIDPAHGGNDIGAIGLEGVKEKDVVLGLALELRKKIKMRFGVPVYMTRNGDYTVERNARYTVARENPVDALIILHAQAAFDEKMSGVHLYINAGAEQDPSTVIQKSGSMLLALNISAALREAGCQVQEVTQSNKFFLPEGDLPTLLIEIGYLTNKTDVDLLTSASGRTLLVEAVADGLEHFIQRNSISK